MRQSRGHRMADQVREQVPLQSRRMLLALTGPESRYTTHYRADRFEPTTGVAPMTLHLSLGPLVSLIAGILILIMPRLLNFIVAIYLIVIGLIGLFGMGSTHF
jgi:hypothetical protein